MKLRAEDYALSKLTPPEPWAELYAEADAQLAQFVRERRLKQARMLAGAVLGFTFAGMLLYWLFS